MNPLSKKQPVEIVVAHYKENINWVYPYTKNYRVHIYDKGSNNLREICESWDVKITSLPNVGRESQTYLYHIVNNWDNLADWTVFFQGGQPSWGYDQPKLERFRLLRQGIPSGGHLCSGVSIQDYLDNRNPLYYIHTAEVTGDLSRQRMRNLYTRYYPVVPERVNSFPRLTPHDHWGKWTDFRDFRAFVDRKRYSLDNSINWSLSEFWYRYISFRPFPQTISFAQGAQFSVGRDWIRQRPLEYYRTLLDLLSDECDPYLGYYMEWVWGEIWNPVIPH